MAPTVTPTHRTARSSLVTLTEGPVVFSYESGLITPGHHDIGH